MSTPLLLKTVQRAFSFTIISLALSSCMSLPKADLRAPVNQKKTWEERKAKLESVKSWTIAGAMAIKNQKQGGQVRFHWQQNQENYEINLTAPLGGLIAEVKGRPDHVTLQKPDEAVKRAKNPEKLLQEELGWSIPLSYAKHWIRGLPIPDVEAETFFDEFSHLSSLRQAGWLVEYTQYTQVRGVDVPAKIRLSRPPLQVRMVVTSWS